jgi:uncharacterized membrane protein YhaH (DUF805 family)
MAYSDSIGDNAQLLKKTVTGVADFSGRSRRTEVIYYWIASALVGVMLHFAVSTVASFETSLLFGRFLQLVLLVPVFALFVRRLHDQDRSGWWGLLLPLSVILSIPRVLTELRGDVAEIITQKMSPVSVAAGLCVLAIFVLCLLPGTEGPNRYGPDPRLDET